MGVTAHDFYTRRQLKRTTNALRAGLKRPLTPIEEARADRAEQLGLLASIRVQEFVLALKELHTTPWEMRAEGLAKEMASELERALTLVRNLRADQ